MITRRHLLLAIALVVVLSLLTSTVGLSQLSIGRGVHGEVVNDPNAYLGLDQELTGPEDGTVNLTVTVTNQFPSGADLDTVEVTVNGTTVDLAEPSPLGPSESASHTFETVSCSDSVRIVASGPGVSARLEQPVVCT